MREQDLLFLLKIAAITLEIFCLARLWSADAPNKRIRGLLLLYFGVFLQGDVSQVLTQGYLFPGGLDQPVIIASKMAYRLALAIFVALVLYVTEPPRWRVLFRKETWVGSAIVAPFIAHFLVAVWRNRAILSAYMVGSEFALFGCTFVAFGVAVFVLSRSHATRWARLAAGLLIACVAALGKRYQAHIGAPPTNVFYEIVWSIGLALQATVVIHDSADVQTLKTNTHGILETAKLSIIVCTFFSTVAILALEAPSARTVQIVTLMSLAGVALVVALDRFFSRIRKMVSESLEGYFQTQQLPSDRLSLLPPEYQEVMHRILDHNLGIVKAQEREKNKADTERSIRISQDRICSQVSHDIRSPLAALEMLLGGTDMSNVSEESRNLARSAVSRISDIAYSLEKSRENLQVAKREPRQQPVLIATEVLAAVAEKRAECRGKAGLAIESNISSEGFFLFSDIDHCNLRRALSNLLNNSIQALPREGLVQVAVNLHPFPPRMCQISIKDDGHGIPAHLLPLIGERGRSFGKDGGKGLGLSHAIDTARAAGGNLDLQSQESVGTEVVVSLPIADAPHWFAANLTVESDAQILVLDDDQAIHHVWRRKLIRKEGEAKVELFHCEGFAKLLEQLETCDARRQIVILSDFELIGSANNGLALIVEHDLASFTTLVTSHYGDGSIQRRCVANGIKILPKQIVPHVNISFHDGKSVPDAILIDDDPLIRRAWHATAKAADIQLHTFSSPEAFLRAIGRYPACLPVYIDSHLAGGVRGETFAQDLSGWGFDNLYMATGAPAADFAHLPFLRGVLGKSAPFPNKKNEPSYVQNLWIASHG